VVASTPTVGADWFDNLSHEELMRAKVQTALVVAVLIIAITAAYANHFHNSFHFDNCIAHSQDTDRGKGRVVQGRLISRPRHGDLLLLK
jgi:hypothetical protein